MKLLKTLALLPTISSLEISTNARFGGGLSVIEDIFGSGRESEVNELSNHGCWCRALKDGQSEVGGAPFDEIDAECRNWFRARRCLQDRQVASVECDVEFDTVNGLYYSIDNGQCSDTDQCLSDVCNVDVHFANRLSTMMQETTLDNSRTSDSCVAATSGTLSCDAFDDLLDGFSSNNAGTDNGFSIAGVSTAPSQGGNASPGFSITSVSSSPSNGGNASPGFSISGVSTSSNQAGSSSPGFSISGVSTSSSQAGSSSPGSIADSDLARLIAALNDGTLDVGFGGGDAGL